MLNSYFLLQKLILDSFKYLILSLFVGNIDWLSLSGRHDNSCNLIFFFLQISLGTPLECMLVWSSHLTIFEWQQWSCLTFNQSTEILILRFSPFFFKNFDYSAQQQNIRLWDRLCVQWIVTLWFVTKWNFPDLRS